MKSSYIPYRATVFFQRTGEPEIVMEETFSIKREYPAEAWASVIAKHTIGYDWLFEAIVIIRVSYWYKIQET